MQSDKTRLDAASRRKLRMANTHPQKIQQSFSYGAILIPLVSNRLQTSDRSRNNFWLAIPTGGKAWHNNTSCLDQLCFWLGVVANRPWCMDNPHT